MSDAERFLGPHPSQDETIRDQIKDGVYFAAEQPDFGPDHIKHADQLLAGMEVETVLNNFDHGPYIERARVIGTGLRFDISEGFVEDPAWWSLDLGDGEFTSHVMSDDGLVPYEKIGWQQNRYVRIAADVDSEAL